METPNALKSLRIERGWTQEQLAGISGVSVRTIQRIEQGGQAALESEKALAAAFGLSLAELRARTIPYRKEEAMSDSQPLPPPIETASCEGRWHHCSVKQHLHRTRTPEERRRHFLRHLGSYLIVMAGLTLLNLANNPGHLWVLYPAIIWGIFLALQAFNCLIPCQRKPVAG